MQRPKNRHDIPAQAAEASGTRDTSPSHSRAPNRNRRRSYSSAAEHAGKQVAAASAAAVVEIAAAEEPGAEQPAAEPAVELPARSQPRKKCRIELPPQFAGGHLGKLDFRSLRCSLVVIRVRTRRHHAHQDPEKVKTDMNNARDDAAPKSRERHPSPTGRRTAVLYRIKFEPANDRPRNSGNRPAADECQDRQDQSRYCFLAIVSARILLRIARRRPVLGSRLLTDEWRRRSTERGGAVEAKGCFCRVWLITFWARLCHISENRGSGFRLPVIMREIAWEKVRFRLKFLILYNKIHFQSDRDFSKPNRNVGLKAES